MDDTNMKDTNRLKLQTDLTHGNEYKTLLIFTIPILLGNLMQQFYNIADSAIVGQLLGKNALAAVGASYQISNIILAVSMGITIGMSILISQMCGAKKYETIQKVVDTGIVLCIFLSLIITVNGIIFARPILHLFQIPDDIFEQSVCYFVITCIGTFSSFGFNAATNYLRGIGDSKTPLLFLIASTVLNISLDFVLILIFHLDVAGASLATVLSECAAFIGIMIYTRKKCDLFTIHFLHLNFDRSILKQGLRIGIPATLQQLFIGLGNSVIQIMINSYGSVIIAAYTVTAKLEGFAILPAVNIGKSISNYVAQNQGAGSHTRVRKGIKAGVIMISLTCIFFTVLILIFNDQFIHLFCSESSVIATGKHYLNIVSPFYIVFGLMQLLNGILLGIGKSGYSLAGSLLSFCAFQVPIAIVLSIPMGVTGIWLAAPCGWIAGLILRVIFLKHIYKK